MTLKGYGARDSEKLLEFIIKRKGRRLREETLGVAREHGNATNVAQVEVEENDTLQSDSSASVWWGAHAEGIDVMLDRLGVDLVLLGALDQKLGIVDTLSSRKNLLTTHEEVVRVGVAGVLGVGHGVEGTDGERELVQHEKVGVVLLLDQLSELALSLGREVVKVTHFDTVLAQKGNSILVLEAESLGQVLELLEGVLAVDNLEIGSVLLLETLEDVDKELVKDIKNLVVVLLKGHLQIESHELGHVAVSEGVLGTEDTADLVDALEISANNHLLVELRRLGQVSIGY